MQTKRFGLCAALSAAALLLLAGCAGSGSTAAPALTVESSYPLQYAKQFTVDECTGGYELITIADSQYLVVPQGAAVPEDLPQGTTVLQQPIENIYLVSTSAMDPIISLGALDSIALSGTKADGWYLPEAKAAMQAGQIAYAGKYSAPDYETILASGCGLAIENTMIYHTPEVKEQLEKFGIPVLVERSSYETDPLARMEWVKLYGILLGKQQEAEQLFDTQVQRVAPLENQQPTGKTVAVFLHHFQQPCHGAQRQRLCGPHDRNGGRQLCLCGPDGQWQQSGHHQSFAGRFLRRCQGRRCAALQQHH